MAYDPITLKVLWDRLIAITQDAAATMCRTTFSSIVRESNDYCCSLIDIQGRQLAEPPFTMPSFTGTLPLTVRQFLRKYPISELRPGDSLVTNDPWLGTGHLNDFNIATPIFDTTGRMIAIASSTSHMSDIGGALNYGNSRDVHEEGLRIPIMKIVREGVLNEDLMELIRYNVRLPEQDVGDVTAMLAANETMAKRLLELVEEAEIHDFATLSEEIQRRSEEAMRGAIAEVPTGTYHGSVTFDGMNGPITIQATVGIADNEVHVDFAGTSPQDRATSVNVVLNYTYSFSVYCLKLLIHPRLPSNDGCLRPLKITAPPGTILNSQYPAAGFSRTYTGHMIHAAIFSALQEALPDRVWAHSGSSPSILEILNGPMPDGRSFVHLFITGTGTGACPTKDGEVCSFPSNPRATALETTEHMAPILFERRELLADSGGAGKYRGGLASLWSFKSVAPNPITYIGWLAHLNHPAKGLLGGGDGSLNRLFLDGRPLTASWGHWEVAPGGIVTKELSGGGGLHSPLLRTPELVLEDVLEGYVSVERARQDYGVIIENGAIAGFTPARQAVAAEGADGSAGGITAAGTARGAAKVADR